MKSKTQKRTEAIERRESDVRLYERSIKRLSESQFPVAHEDQIKSFLRRIETAKVDIQNTKNNLQVIYGGI